MNPNKTINEYFKGTLKRFLKYPPQLDYLEQQLIFCRVASSVNNNDMNTAIQNTSVFDYNRESRLFSPILAFREQPVITNSQILAGEKIEMSL